jgi:phosphoribosylformylglycinamidine cyclo-ligase
VPRMLPEGLGAELDLGSYVRPPVFDLLQRLGEVEEHEMRRTFNLGVGLVVAVRPEDAQAVADAIRGAGESVWTLGKVIETPGAVDEDRVRIL